jgi:hypothetical protein
MAIEASAADAVAGLARLACLLEFIRDFQLLRREHGELSANRAFMS